MTADVTLGVVAGIVFAWLWLWVVPWAVHGRFFRAMAALTRKILAIDDAGEFWQVYKALLGHTARYVGRNIAGTVVAGIPVVGVYILVRDDAPFLAAFVASMLIVFCWPRLWPARTAF